MTRLPPPLARWAHELARLPDPLIAALAPWLGRLALAVGPMPGDRRADAGEVDGVDGLSRKGSYERLLMSEWALADEFPDEFLRRAASNEHLFVARAHRAPPVQRRSVVLIAAGPSQLGAPRLLHLAALVVMARRAAAAGAALAWGVLEHPQRALSSSLDPRALTHLFDARTATVAGPAHASAWLAELGPGAVDDRWLIGGDDHAALARELRAAALVVRDPFEPDERVLDVEVRDAAAPHARAKLRLPLPPPDDAARLVREPFAGARAPARAAVTATVQALRAIWFVAGGQRLAIDQGQGKRVELFPVPSSPREPAGHPRTFDPPSDGTVVALGIRRRVTIGVTWFPSAPEKLWVHDHRAGAHPTQVILPDAVVAAIGAGRAAAAGGPGLAAYLPLDQGSTRTRLVVQVGGALLTVADRGVPVRAAVLGLDDEVDDAEVLGATVVDGAALFAQVHRDHRIELRRADAAGVRTVARIERRAGVAADVRFGFAIPPRGTWGPVAVRVDDRRWEVVEGGATATSIACDTRVHGVITRSGDVRLLCEAADGRGLVLRGRADTIPLPPADGELVGAACGGPRPVVAWATRTSVVVYSLHYGAVLLRIAREAP